MKMIFSCLLALMATGTALSGQQVRTDEPEIAVGVLLAASLTSGPTALDDRALRPGHSFALRARAKSQRLAGLLRADVVPGASTLKCGALPSSCSIGKYKQLVVIGDPVVQGDGNSALVTVRTVTVTGLPRVPLHTGETVYSLTRRNGNWIVVSKKVTRTT